MSLEYIYELWNGHHFTLSIRFRIYKLPPLINSNSTKLPFRFFATSWWVKTNPWENFFQVKPEAINQFCQPPIQGSVAYRLLHLYLCSNYLLMRRWWLWFHLKTAIVWRIVGYATGQWLHGSGSEPASLVKACSH